MRYWLRTVLSIASIPFIVILYLNIEVLAAAYGWDTLLLSGYPDLINALTKPWVFAFAAFIVGNASGVWLHWCATKYDRLNGGNVARTQGSGRNDWAIGLSALSIQDAACAFAGVEPSQWKDSTRAHAIAVDMLSQTSNGYIGTPEDYVARIGKTGAVLVGAPHFNPKPNVSVATIVDVRSLADYAKDRDVRVDWLLDGNTDLIGTYRRQALQKKSGGKLPTR